MFTNPFLVERLSLDTRNELPGDACMEEDEKDTILFLTANACVTIRRAFSGR